MNECIASLPSCPMCVPSISILHLQTTWPDVINDSLSLFLFLSRHNDGLNTNSESSMESHQRLSIIFPSLQLCILVSLSPSYHLNPARHLISFIPYGSLVIVSLSLWKIALMMLKNMKNLLSSFASFSLILELFERIIISRKCFSQHKTSKSRQCRKFFTQVEWDRFSRRISVESGEGKIASSSTRTKRILFHFSKNEYLSLPNEIIDCSLQYPGYVKSTQQRKINYRSITSCRLRKWFYLVSNFFFISPSRSSVFDFRSYLLVSFLPS